MWSALMTAALATSPELKPVESEIVAVVHSRDTELQDFLLAGAWSPPRPVSATGVSGNVRLRVAGFAIAGIGQTLNDVGTGLLITSVAGAASAKEEGVTPAVPPWAGLGFKGVGAVLVVGGLLTVAVSYPDPKRDKKASLSPWFSPDGAGVTVAGVW